MTKIEIAIELIKIRNELQKLFNTTVNRVVSNDLDIPLKEIAPLGDANNKLEEVLISLLDINKE